VPSNEQRRQAAKRKLERQLTRRAERAKKRRVWGVGLTVLVVVALVGLVFWLTNLGPDDSSAATKPSDDAEAAGKTTDGPCAYKENPAEKPEKDPGMPEDPKDTPKKGTVGVDLKTSQGDIEMTLDRAKAPCTVQSMEHLVKEKYFDGTKCHRMVASAGLKVLQCGDPKGDGTGGPGYSIPDELPKDLAAAPGGQAGGQPLSVYKRGMLAMANAGPETGGSQFFIVSGDSTLPPSYTVFGEISASGMKVVDKIAKGGITAGQSPEDGAPKLPVDIETATVKG
jgi:peptidyl-prolyl cis-trans isomerase B (cyclophilin B)